MDDVPTRRQCLLAVGAVGMAGLAGCSNANSDADAGSSIGGAPMYQYTPANTGHAPAETGPSESVTRRWTVDAVGGVRSSPAVVGGTVYVGSDTGTVYAIDADGGESGSSLVVADDAVFVNGAEGTVALTPE